MEDIIDARCSAQAYVENFVYDQTGKNIRLDRLSTAFVKTLSEAVWNVQNPKVEKQIETFPKSHRTIVRHHDEEQLDD